jgi:hypothetical protein
VCVYVHTLQQCGLITLGHTCDSVSCTLDGADDGVSQFLRRIDCAHWLESFQKQKVDACDCEPATVFTADVAVAAMFDIVDDVDLLLSGVSASGPMSTGVGSPSLSCGRVFMLCESVRHTQHMHKHTVCSHNITARTTHFVTPCVGRRLYLNDST